MLFGGLSQCYLLSKVFAMYGAFVLHKNHEGFCPTKADLAGAYVRGLLSGGRHP